MNQNPNEFHIELGKPLFMATNPVYPGRNTARRLLNVHTHRKPQAIIPRPGYSLYLTIDDDNLDSFINYLNFDFFFDKQTIQSGKEIICYLQSAIHSAIKDTGGDPIILDTQQTLNLWIYPYWNGSDWTNSWKKLSQLHITKITTGSDATYSNMIEIYSGTATTPAIAADSLISWIIYNKTKDEYAKIITNKAVDTEHTRINHTLFNCAWEADDVVIISKFLLDKDFLSETANITWDQIQTHTLNNDLRIGFGGMENRPGLAVGYRKNNLLIEKIDFADVHSDLTDAAIETFAAQDGVMIDTAIANIEDGYGVDLVEITGTLPTNTYYVRLTALLDNSQEMMVFDTKIDLAGSSNLEAYPWFNVAKMNPRVTKLRLYMSTDNITFYQKKEYTVRADDFAKSTWILNENGKLYLGSGELHNESNAAAVDNANEINSVGSWTDFQVLSVLAVDTVGSDSGSYSLRIGTIAFIKPIDGARIGIKFPIPGLKQNTKYTVEFQAKADGSSGTTAYAFFVGESLSMVGRPQTTIDITSDAFDSYSITVDTGLKDEDPKYIVFASQQPTSDDRFNLDQISIKESNLIEITPTSPQGTEMKTAIGYNATYNLVKGWDQALQFNGRSYYLNPYVDKRFQNYMYVSFISGQNGFMNDVAAFENSRDLALNDSFKVIGMALLPTFELLILKDKSINVIDPETGQGREPIEGISCASLNSIKSINGIIFWNGYEDAYSLNIGNGLRVLPLLKNSIRDLYAAISDKTKLVGARDFFNTYRIRINDDSSKKEFLFTENGPIEEAKHDFALVYKIDSSGNVVFMDKLGHIYKSTLDDTSDNEIAIPIEISSAIFKCDLEFGNKTRALLNNITIGYSSDVNLSLVYYYKRDNSMSWENSSTYTISKDSKRLVLQLPPHLTVIDFYVKITGNITSLEIDSIQIFGQKIYLGKFGG